MTIKSDINIFRGICLLIIFLGFYYLKINNGFFGFIITTFLLLFIFAGSNTMEITNDSVVFKFKRLLPIWEKQKTIQLQEIKSIKFIEGKSSGLSILLNLIKYVPGTLKPNDEIIIELLNGSLYRHEKIGSKKQFKKAISLLEKRI